MKGLSTRAPWAYMIAAGLKPYETRKWQTDYRGPLVICVPTNQKEEPFAGMGICLVNLVDIWPMTEADSGPACIACYPKAKVWKFADLQRIRPVAIKQKLGLFDVDPRYIETLGPP